MEFLCGCELLTNRSPVSQATIPVALLSRGGGGGNTAGLRGAPTNGKMIPIEISFLDFEAIVLVTNPLTHLIE